MSVAGRTIVCVARHTPRRLPIQGGDGPLSAGPLPLELILTPETAATERPVTVRRTGARAFGAHTVVGTRGRLIIDP